MPELSEEIAGEGAPVDEGTTDDVVIEQGGDAGGSDASNAEVEAEAREMGWVPQDEWKGPADKWRPADEFVERGKTILPIVRSQLQKEREERAKDRKEFEDRMARYERMSAKALDRQREKLEAEFKERRMRAVELGDVEGFKSVEKEEAEALAELDEAAKGDEPKKDDKAEGRFSQAETKALESWMSENTWFKTDPKLTAVMDAEFADVMREMPAATLAEKLAEARSRVAEAYPSKFGKTAATRRAPVVESGARVPGGGQPGKLAAKLPAEARAAGQKFVEQKLFANLEEYAKSYFEDEA